VIRTDEPGNNHMMATPQVKMNAQPKIINSVTIAAGGTWD
jgi:hypothetical protein